MPKFILTGKMGVSDAKTNEELIPFALFTCEVDSDWSDKVLSDKQYKYFNFVLETAYNEHLIRNKLLLPFVEKDWMVGQIGWPTFKIQE